MALKEGPMCEPETVKLKAGGKYYETPPEPVLPPCDEKNNGHWLCAVHRNEWTDDGPNCLDGYGRTWQGREGCRAVWICHEHGPEQP
jgi:hypothetical protein